MITLIGNKNYSQQVTRVSLPFLELCDLFGDESLRTSIFSFHACLPGIDLFFLFFFFFFLGHALGWPGFGQAVATYSAQTFAEENQALYFEVNALGGQNVMESVSETLRLSVEPLFFQRLSSHQINRLNLVATTSLKQ